MTSRVKPWVGSLLRLLIVAGAALFITVAGALLAVRTFGLPLRAIGAPDGPYAVGSIDVLFTDPHRPEIFADADLPRRVPAQILYPIAKAASRRSPYVAHPAATLANISRVHGRFLAMLLQGIRRLDAPWSTTHAPAAAGRSPVIIYLPGLTGYREMNSYQTTDLAANGYVVIVLDQPGAVAASVMPDGTVIDGLDRAGAAGAVRPEYLARQPVALPLRLVRCRPGQRSVVPYLAADASLVLDRLSALNEDPHSPISGKLDTSRVGVFGMSLGAIVTARACADDPRLDACLMMDAAMPIDVARVGLRQPALWLTRDADAMRRERRSAGGWPEDEIAITQSSMRDAARRSEDGVVVDLPGTYHFSFTDLAGLTPVFGWLGLAPDIDARATQREIAMQTRGFFDRKLD